MRRNASTKWETQGRHKTTRVEIQDWMLVNAGRGDTGGEVWGVIMQIDWEQQLKETKTGAVKDAKFYQSKARRIKNKRQTAPHLLT
ncbi:hypothetical protein E2C01_038391 [Portunus trituberculatus]|uniref:Uncharacterized protein n=1 Tax=Portunus trituberculatus TaxID=210409 RepID=A0A5B7FE22_PORTR|nr:hypothetical protein [Portunus trituberculatus]